MYFLSIRTESNSFKYFSLPIFETNSCYPFNLIFNQVINLQNTILSSLSIQKCHANPCALAKKACIWQRRPACRSFGAGRDGGKDRLPKSCFCGLAFSIFSLFKFAIIILLCRFFGMRTTLSICKVGDCGLQTYQTEMKLKRAATVEFTTTSTILYIHLCYRLAFLLVHNLYFVHH